MSQIVAAILAAGRGKRMGRCKMLLRIGNLSLIEYVVKNIQASDVDRIIVVLGYEADKVSRKVPDGIKSLFNSRYEEGQSTSFKMIIDYVKNDADAVLFVMGDMPFVTTSIINRIVSAYLRTGAKVVIPMHQGIAKNPTLFDKSLFNELMNIRGDLGVGEVLKRHLKEAEKVEVDSSTPFFDIDTEQDLAIARKIFETGIYS